MPTTMKFLRLHAGGFALLAFLVLVAFDGVVVAQEGNEKIETQQIREAIANASAEFGVAPEALEAVAFMNSNWSMPSCPGGTDPLKARKSSNGDSDHLGTGIHAMPAQFPPMGLCSDPSCGNTLDRAARLLRKSPEVLACDYVDNIRGAAAILAEEVRTKNLQTYSEAASVFSGNISQGSALFQSRIQRILTGGTVVREQISIRPIGDVINQSPPEAAPTESRQPQANPGQVRVLPEVLQPAPLGPTAGYPGALWYPAADTNFSVGRSGSAPKIVVLHSTESTVTMAIAKFQTAGSNVSAHYLIGADGTIYQTVSDTDTAFHSGNSTTNRDSIGIMLEGCMDVGVPGCPFGTLSWQTPNQYSSLVNLIQWLLGRYSGLDADRTSIIGHNEVTSPGSGTGVCGTCAGSTYWGGCCNDADPGPFLNMPNLMSSLYVPPVFAQLAVTSTSCSVRTQPTSTAPKISEIWSGQKFVSHFKSGTYYQIDLGGWEYAQKYLASKEVHYDGWISDSCVSTITEATQGLIEGSFPSPVYLMNAAGGTTTEARAIDGKRFISTGDIREISGKAWYEFNLPDITGANTAWATTDYMPIVGSLPAWYRQFPAGGYEKNADMISTADSGFMTAGLTYSFGAGNSDAWLVKVASNGTVSSGVAYGGPPAVAYGDSGFDSAESISRTADGGFISSGYTSVSIGPGTSSTWYDGLFIKLTSTGAYQWMTSFNGSVYCQAPCVSDSNKYNSTDLFRDATQASDGGFVAVGETRTGSAGGPLPSDYWLLKTDSGANLSWSTAISGANTDVAMGVARTSDGFISVGFTNSYGAGNYDIFLVKFTAAGGITWQKTIGSSSYLEEAFDVIVGADGYYYVVGYAAGSRGGDLWIGKISSSGTVSWQKTIGSSYYDDGAKLIQTRSGDLLLVGTTYSAGSADMWVVKLDTTGNIIWQKAYGAANLDETGTAIVEMADRSLAISGTVSGDIVVVKTTEDGSCGTCANVRTTAATTSTFSGSLYTVTASNIFSLNSSRINPTLFYANSGVPGNTAVCSGPGKTDFAISCAQSTFAIKVGQSATSSCNVTSYGGFTKSVTLGCEGLPAGITCTFTPTSLTPPANGTSSSSTFKVTVAGGTPGGTYSFKIGATASSGEKHYSNVEVSALAPDFRTECLPNPVSIGKGTAAILQCTTYSLNDFSSAVSLSCPSIPSGLSCSYSPSSVTPPANGSVQHTLTITASSSISTGTYNVSIKGTSGTLSRTQTESVTIPKPDFTVSCEPSTLTIGVASQANMVCTVHSLWGFSSSVSLSCASLPTGLTCPTINPTSVKPPAYGDATTTVTVKTSSGIGSGTKSFSFKGSTSTITKTTAITVIVPPKDFAISCTPANTTVAPGATSTVTCNVQSLYGFSNAVSLSSANLPSGISTSYSPTSVTPPAYQTASSILSISAASGKPNGTYSFQVKGVNGSLSHTFDIAVTVADNEAPQVSITSPVAGATLTKWPVTLTASASDNGSVASVDFYYNSTKIGTDSAAPYSISWNTSLVTNGNYLLTARATDGSGNATVSAGVSVTVNNPALSFVFPKTATDVRMIRMRYGNGDSYPENQPTDGQLTITLQTTPGGKTIYLRVTDPPDPSGYLTGSIGDNGEHGTVKLNGATEISTGIFKVVSDSVTGLATVTMALPQYLFTGTSTYVPWAMPGDNFVIEAATESSFSCGSDCLKSGRVTVWERVYVENTQMYKAGQFIFADSGAGTGRPKKIFVDNPGVFTVGEPVQLSTFSSPGVLQGEDATVIAVDVANKFIKVELAGGASPNVFYKGLGTSDPCASTYPYSYVAKSSLGTFGLGNSEYASVYNDAFYEVVEVPGRTMPLFDAVACGVANNSQALVTFMGERTSSYRVYKYIFNYLQMVFIGSLGPGYFGTSAVTLENNFRLAYSWIARETIAAEAQDPIIGENFTMSHELAHLFDNPHDPKNLPGYPLGFPDWLNQAPPDLMVSNPQDFGLDPITLKYLVVPRRFHAPAFPESELLLMRVMPLMDYVP